MQEDTSFRGDVIGLCISIKGRHTEGKGRHQQGLSFNIVYYYTYNKSFHFVKVLDRVIQIRYTGGKLFSDYFKTVS